MEDLPRMFGAQSQARIIATVNYALLYSSPRSDSNRNNSKKANHAAYWERFNDNNNNSMRERARQ